MPFDDSLWPDDSVARPSAPPAREAPAGRAVEQARELERQLQVIAEALPTAEEHAVRIVEAALDTLGASTGIAFRLTEGGDWLELVGAAHLPGDLGDRFRRIPLDAALPFAAVVRTGRPSYCESREQLLGRHPAMRELVERLDLHAVAAVPTRHLAQVQGAVAFGFRAPRRFTGGEKALLRALGGRYARALRSARRYFAEHDARAAAEAARRTAEGARAVAEATARAQGDYVAVISHELRTPLQAILGYAELLTEGVAGKLTPRQHGFAERIVAGSETLLQLVENLLGFSAAQVGQQRVDVELFDPGQLAREVATLAEPLAARKGLAIRVESCAPALAMSSDRRKVRQILTNLVGNAVKFTAQGEVAVVVARGAPERVRIAVRDTGAGITAGELPHLFEPFWQGARPAAGGGGTGLGLSIVRQLARLLGGDVAVESAPGQGSTFTVDLPLVATGDAVGGATPARRRDPADSALGG